MWAQGAYAGGTHTCALIREKKLLALSPRDTRVRVYGFEQNILSYVHGTTSDGTTSDGTLHTTARGGQSCSQSMQANSCD